MKKFVVVAISGLIIGLAAGPALAQDAGLISTFPVVDTMQEKCYGNMWDMECPGDGQAFYGQDAQFFDHQSRYTGNGDGTVNDEVTGLLWQQSPDTNGDGNINNSDKFTYSGAQSYCQNLVLGGRDDWRLPPIKELYSLMDFRGTDPSGSDDDTTGLVPYLDPDYFAFGWGDTAAGSRIIDAQYASDTLYAANSGMMFGVNFADGRIKGYGMNHPGGQEMEFYVKCVSGGVDYAQNNFSDNGNGTITDHASGLMWAQNDSGGGMNWEEALDFVQARNDEGYMGYSDWRMPNIKELQGIVDYNRSPDTTGTAAIDQVFSSTQITNEGGQADYPYYWSGTTHASANGRGSGGAYVAFGRGLGYMNGSWRDVHGAGCQRSDPKTGDPADYPEGHGPQGDAIRIYNYVRLVRNAN